MTEAEKIQLDWHFTPAVCRTLRGCQIHIANMSLGWRWKLCWHLECKMDELPRVFWREVTMRRKKCA